MSRLRLVGLGLILALATSARSADGPAGSIVGEVVLPSKITVRYEYHFDQNALSDFRIVGDHLVALTESGALLRFDAKTRKPQQKRFEATPIACLGTGRDNSILAGFEDGRVCKVEPSSLGLTELVKLDGAPRWLEMRHGGLLAVVERSVKVKAEGDVWTEHQAFVLDASSGKTSAVGHRVSTFLLDRQDRLWLGHDRGEWGGKVWRVNLKDGTIDVIAAPKVVAKEASWKGIYGFVELPNGQVLAYGGTMHMERASCFVSRVDSENAVELASFSNDDEIKAAREKRELPARPDHARYPITKILEEADGRLLVFSYDSIYRIDPKLTKWERVCDLKLKYRSGRPDSVGVYPAIKSVQPLPGPGFELLCATTLDGFQRFADGKLTREALPGRLGASRIEKIVSSTDGLLFFEGDSVTNPWRIASGVWEQRSFVPPFVMLPEERKEREQAEAPPEDETPWGKTKILIGTDGKVVSVSESDRENGTRTTVRWNDGKPEVLGSEMSSIDSDRCFLTPDGGLWNVGDNALYRFTESRWIDVMKPPDKNKGEDQSRVVWNVGADVRIVDRIGPRWVLFDHENQRLLSFDDRLDGKTPGFRLELRADVRVFDVIPWTNGELLLATNIGLKRYEIRTHTLNDSPVPQPPTVPSKLCKDGLGRVWMIAAEQLWMATPGEKAANSFQALPMIGENTVEAFAADPAHGDGIVFGLGDGAVVFLRVPKRQ